MNDYYDNSINPLSYGDIAKATEIENKFDEVKASFDKLPDEQRLNRNTTSFVASDSGSANTYAVAMHQTLSSYIDGMQVVFRVANANTGASTVNVDSVGAKTIKRVDGDDLVSGDFPAGAIVELRYDSTNGYFVLVSFTMAAVTSAETAQTAAETAQTAAETAQSAAETAETNAETAQTNAETAQTNAETAETNAETAETNAETAETNAETAETNAETAQTAAETAQTAAETAQSAAETAETNAAASESAASTSETNAAASESAASTSESNASTSESNAATSEANAAASYDSFDDRYLGAKASDPATDNDGNALIEGALYFNSSTDQMKVYNGSSWEIVSLTALVTDTSPQLGGDLDTNGYLVKNGITLSKNVIDTSYTIPDGYNAMSVGPLDINTTIIINETWEIL